VNTPTAVPPWQRSVPYPRHRAFGIHTLTLPPAKSRTIAVRLVSMAMTGYYKTFSRPRTHRPLSMLKYDPVGKHAHSERLLQTAAFGCLDTLLKPSDAVKKQVLFLEQKRGGGK